MDQPKPVCKVALVSLDEPTAAILRDVFRQFQIQALNVATKDDYRLGEERFDACVLRLLPGCQPILEALRGSRRDRNVIIYGISTPGQTMQQAAKFGINVLLNDPVDHQAAMRAVRSTYLLVLNEFRRYVRVPIITEVQLKSGSSRYEGSSVDLSGGGMSLRTNSKLKIGETVEVSFTLPRNQNFSCSAAVCWAKSDGQLIGIRFNRSDDRREPIRRWIEEYLGT